MNTQKYVISPTLNGVDLFPMPVRDEDLVEWDGELDLPIPEDFKAFLQEHNGAEFRSTVRIATSSSDIKVRKMLELLDLAKIFGLHPDMEYGDLRQAGFALEFEDRVPDNFVAIGHFADHARVVLCTSGPDRGKVYIWDPGLPWEKENVQTTRYLTLIADNFASFWQQLYSEAN